MPTTRQFSIVRFVSWGAGHDIGHKGLSTEDKVQIVDELSRHTRVLISSECIGDADWFIRKASEYGSQRNVFDRPIAQNQGIQFPIAESYAATRAAALMRDRAAELFEAGEPCGEEANLAKYLSSEASWKAADTCMQTFGGFAFAEEYDVERKFREARLYRIAPISNNLVLSYVAEHVLGMPRSY